MKLVWVGSVDIYFVNVGSKVIANVSFKFLAQLLLELLIEECRDVADKRDFRGQISFFGRTNSKNTSPIILKFGTVASLMDVN